MKVESDVSSGAMETSEVRAEGLRGLVEEFGIHMLLEVSLVGLIDRFLMNTVLSMLVGVSIVEGCQFLWRKWRED